MCRKDFVHLVSITIALFSCIAITQAQSTEFTYQGRLLFGDVPANGNYDFEFALFDADTVGNQLGSTFPLSAVSVNNGVFSVRIDFGNQFPGANRFLEIHVRQTGATTFAVLSPRQSISSAPYSIKSLNAVNSDNAVNASQLGGVTANQFVVTNDLRLLDARDPRPNSANYIQNATSQQALSNFNISGTGTANIFNAASQYNIGGSRILSNPGSSNLFAGVLSGNSNSSGSANSFFGSLSGQNNTTGEDNSFFGASSGHSNTTGFRNSFFGRFTGGLNTSGSSNSIFGWFAGSNNTSGNDNSFFGSDAGANNTTGGANSFFGSSTGGANTIGISNSFFGASAGLGNTTGSGDTFIGSSAGSNNTTGSGNAFFGSGAGSGNTTGNNNTAIGNSANFGSGNLNFATAIGAGSIASTNNTIVIGRTADGVVVPGSFTVSGTSTSDILSAGTSVRAPIYYDSNNTSYFLDPASTSNTNFLRFNTVDCINGFCPPNNAVRMTPNFHLNSGAGNAVIINWDNGTTGTNATFRIGNGQASEVFRVQADGSVGIGTTAPAEKLDVATNAGHVLLGDAGCNAGFTGIGFGTSLSGCTNFSLVGNGTDTIVNRPVGGVIHFREANSTQLAIAPGGFVGIGTASPTAPLTVFSPNTSRFDLLTSSPGNPSFGYSQSVRADGQWILATNTGSSRIAVDGSGFVAIGGTPTPAARLFVNGDLKANGSIFVGNLVGSGTQSVCLTGAGGFLAQCSSSIRYKSNIRNFNPGLDLIKHLRPVSFNWKSNNAPDMGLVAEDVAKVEPLLVTHNQKGEVEGVKYDRVGVVLVNAVNEQQAEIESLRKLVDQQNIALRQQQELARRQQAEIESLQKLVRPRKSAITPHRKRN